MTLVILLFVGSLLAPRAWQALTVETILLPNRPLPGVLIDPLPEPEPRLPALQPQATLPPSGRLAQLAPAAERLPLQPRVAARSRGNETFVSEVGPIARRPLPPELRQARPIAELPRVTTTPHPPAMLGRASLAPATAWPLPNRLLEQLRTLEDTPASNWAQQVAAAVGELSEIHSLGDAQVAGLLSRMEQLVEDATVLSPQLLISERTELILARYALQRRLVIWRGIHEIQQLRPEMTVTQVALISPNLLLEQVHQRLADTEFHAGWQKYLMLEELADPELQAADRHAVAQKVLHRMTSPSLSPLQQELMNEQVFTQFAEQLENWGREPVDYRRMLKDLEDYEQAGVAADAEQLAGYWQVLRWAKLPRTAELSSELAGNYRNANIRVAMTGDLLNRLLPQSPATREPVRDVIVGTPVRGRAETRTRLEVQLTPNDHRWQVGLTARGQVRSNTYAVRGPVTIKNRGVAQFNLRKSVSVDGDGIQLGRATGNARSRSFLNGIRTEMDPVPLVGLLMQAIARQQHDSQAGQARTEIRQKVAAQARQRMDQEVRTRVDTLSQEFRTKVLDPIEELDLEPVALEMRTTEERLIARYRLAASDQLGAHTPRPRAPADSLLSVQVHESAINNTLEQLELAGTRREAKQLVQEVAGKFEQQVKLPEDFPDDVIVEFAAEQPIRVRMRDGRIELALRVKELQVMGQRGWRDLFVRAYYRPSDERSGRLQRDGYVELSGRRLRLRDQIALRGIFSKILPRHPDINVLSDELVEHPKLADCEVTQFVVRDGWIGVALGPKARMATKKPVTSSR